jgi:hypothetical protein
VSVTTTSTETSTETTTEETKVDETEATTAETPEGEKPEEGAEGNEGDEEKSEDVPADVLRTKLTKANAEAANYRTRLRELEAKFKDAKTPEEVATAVAELTEANAKLAREVEVAKVARKHKLPDELAELVKGDTPEEMDAHAKTLAKFAGKPAPEDLEGGLDPSAGSDKFDPVATARRARTSRF